MSTKKWTLKNHFEGIPKMSDFEIVEDSLPPLRDGGTYYNSRRGLRPLDSDRNDSNDDRTYLVVCNDD